MEERSAGHIYSLYSEDGGRRFDWARKRAGVAEIVATVRSCFDWGGAEYRGWEVGAHIIGHIIENLVIQGVVKVQSLEQVTGSLGVTSNVLRKIDTK